MVSNSPQHVEQILLKTNKINWSSSFCESTKVTRVSSNTLLWPNVSQKKKEKKQRRRKVPTYKSAAWKSFNSKRNHIKQLLNNEDIKKMPYYEVFFFKAMLHFLFPDLLQLYFLNPWFQSRATSLGEPNLFAAAVQNQFSPDEMCAVFCSPR